MPDAPTMMALPAPLKHPSTPRPAPGWGGRRPGAGRKPRPRPVAPAITPEPAPEPPRVPYIGAIVWRRVSLGRDQAVRPALVVEVETPGDPASALWLATFWPGGIVNESVPAAPEGEPKADCWTWPEAPA